MEDNTPAYFSCFKVQFLSSSSLKAKFAISSKLQIFLCKLSPPDFLGKNANILRGNNLKALKMYNVDLEKNEQNSKTANSLHEHSFD